VSGECRSKFDLTGAIAQVSVILILKIWNKSALENKTIKVVPMKAIVIDRFGSAEELHSADVAIPVPGKNEVLVHVKAVGINPVDFKVRRGTLFFLSGRDFPKIIGGDFAGEVEDTDSGITAFKAGDPVYGMVNAFRGGAYAEYLRVPVHNIARKPERLTFEVAASMPIAALTALQGLRDKGGMTSGMSVLVNGSSGGVGNFAVQIAKAFETKITGVCSTNNVEFSKELGADEVIDYRKTEINTVDAQFDIVFDAVSNLSVQTAKRLLKKSGTYVCTLPTAGKVIMSLVSSVFGSRKISMVMVKARTADLEMLNEMIEQGRLRPVIDKIFPMNEMAEAHRLIETGHTRGKLVVRIDEAADAKK
jgi:NADPH:quinone reductase-like Zn-dependent oxidoreductase